MKFWRSAPLTFVHKIVCMRKQFEIHLIVKIEMANIDKHEISINKWPAISKQKPGFCFVFQISNKLAYRNILVNLSIQMQHMCTMEQKWIMCLFVCSNAQNEHL